MSYDEARARLRRYYRILEVVQLFSLSSTDIVIAVGQNRSSGSATEAEVVRRLDLLNSVQDVEDALQTLTDEQRLFCELRFRDDLSMRQIAARLHRALGAMPQMEREILSAFIAAQGCIPSR
jgi:DNA-directed RNA polymerase specialized sigma24 family protein